MSEELRSTYGSEVCSLSKGHLGKHRCDTRVAIENGCHQSPNSNYRDKRPCPGCGLVAIRTIWTDLCSTAIWSINGTKADENREMVSLCTACKLEASAQSHEYQARKLRRQAAEIRAKRRTRSL
jgi:hypothetical protein